MQVFEVQTYSQSAYIFKPFLSVLAHLKMRYSDYPDSVTGEEERKQYCQNISEAMGFTNTPLEITPEIVTPNKQKKSQTKDAQNKFLGKFLASPKSKIAHVTCYEDLLKLYQSKEYKINDLEMINEEMCQVNLEILTHQKNYINRNNHCIIGAMVVDLAKVALFDAMMKLKEMNCSILYVNTDGIIFSRKKDTTIPLAVGTAYGQFAHQVPDGSITNFVATGAKSYAYWYSDNGEEKSVMRLSGFNLQSEQSSYDPAIFQKLAMDFFKNQVVSKHPVLQARKAVKRKLTEVKDRVFANVHAINLYKKRIMVGSNENEISVITNPYGYYE